MDRAALVKEIMFSTGRGYKTVICVLGGYWRSRKVSGRAAAEIIKKAQELNFPFDEPPEELSIEPLPSFPKLTDDEYPDPDEKMEVQLRGLIGDEDFLKLVENFAGLRMFIPSFPERSKLPELLGARAVVRLSEAYPGGYIRVPLAREFRAMMYRKQGLTNRKSAVRLGITESGVESILKRLRRKGRL